ncbi:MAG: hypothetical protein WC701_04105 [Kiritimatiellales bacterium]
MSLKRVCLIFCFLLTAGGCASFRGIPSHGGGKRFDEEERLVAAAVYTALDQMALPEMTGKKVRIVNEFMTTYGSGNVTFGGLKDIGLSVANTTSDYTVPTRTQADTFSGNIRYSPDMSFYSTIANTDRDAAYFIACLEMKLRHSEITPVLKDEEVTLFILLDVLGTNLGRKDQLINHTDNLSASCEFTYYAVDAKTGKLLFESRRSGSTALYSEKSALFTGHSVIRRSIESMRPLDMPDFHTNRIEAPVEEKTAAEETQKAAVPEEPGSATNNPPAKRPYWQYSIGFLQRLLTTFHTTAPSSDDAAQSAAEQPVPAPEKPVTSGTAEDSQIKALEAQAIQMIQSGERSKATEIMQQMRSIDPAADELKRISVLQGSRQ